jgi:hypothetical protein
MYIYLFNKAAKNIKIISACTESTASVLKAFNNYLCTYDLYSPVHNVLDACISITRASGRGLGPGIREFFGPCEMASSR